MIFGRRKFDHPADSQPIEFEHVVLHRESVFDHEDERAVFQTAEEAKEFIRWCVKQKRWAEYRQEPKRG